MKTLQVNEKTLAGHYQQQAVQYQHVLELVRGLPATIEQGASIDQSLSQLGLMLEEIQSGESQISAVRDRWLASQSKPGRELGQALQTVKELIESLIAKVAVAEQTARKAKMRLFPEMNAESLGRRMQAAYGSASQQVVQ